jgi:hypothetical protein
MLKDYYFWFAQPSTVLNDYDWMAGYVFVGALVLSVIGWLVRKFFISHPVIKKLINKWAMALFWVGVVGLIWFGFRFEAVPIFSKRVWAGAIIAGGLIWLGFVKWYLIKSFRTEKQAYDYNAVKSKYMPGQR